MATKVMVTFPDQLLEEVDRIARDEHRSRTELVREALRLYMGQRQGHQVPGTNPLVRQAVSVQDRLSAAAPGTAEDSTVEIRRWREAR